MSLTSVIRYIRAVDSSTNLGKTGIAFGSFTAKYLTQAGTLASLTTEDITTLGTYQAPTSSAHIRIKELANTDPTKGIYEVHFHNTQMVDTGQKLWLFLSASGSLIQPLELELLPYKADMDSIKGVDATPLSKSQNAIGYGTASGTPSTTSIPTSAMTPAGGAVDQFKGRVLTFTNDTTTAALRGQATDITASTNAATPVFTVTALATAPVAGDTFVIT